MGCARLSLDLFGRCDLCNDRTGWPARSSDSNLQKLIKELSFEIGLEHCHDLFKITAALSRIGGLCAQVIAQMVLKNLRHSAIDRASNRSDLLKDCCAIGL